MEKIVLNEIVVKKNRVDFKYSKPKKLARFFDKKQNFFYEYPTDIDFSDVPKSILVIPFVMNFMPLTWLSGVTLEVAELDDSFYNALPEILKGLKKVYYDVEFTGKLHVKNVQKNNNKTDGKPVVLFSGGVDAVSTLISHIEEAPVLINVWGADILLDDYSDHQVIERDLMNFTKQLNLDFFFIKSSLRWCFNEEELHKEYMPILKDTWWHGIQHSIGLLSLLAPYDYIKNVSINYIASSFTEKEVGIIRCVNYPFIDNKVRMMNTICIHDGFEYKRIDKIRNIVDFCNQSNKFIKLKVCFNPVNGENCCKCEKCKRTIAAILAVNGNPVQLGFHVDLKTEPMKIKEFLDHNIIREGDHWEGTQEYIRQHKGKNPSMDWLADYTFNTYKPGLLLKGFHFLRRILIKWKNKLGLWRK